MKNLVIVESPAKAKTINKILGKDYVVKASMGHVRDLPEKELGVDIDRGFRPKYVTIKSREKVLKELKSLAREADRVYLAPDPDREGEAIAWHLKEALKDDKRPVPFLRVTYNEITAPAIRKAFAEPGELDLNKVNSQQARRILDRLVGYQVSPLLWRRIRGAQSAGRVQSVALRLVCEREREIQNFKPQEYWVLGAKVRKFVDPRDPFLITLAKINGEKASVSSAEQAESILKDLEGRPLKVRSIVRRETSRRPPPPFITSTLQQAASSRLGFTPKRTMQIAQKLYEGVDFGEGPVGLITYMRTDSVAISPLAIDEARQYIAKTFGPEYVPDQPNVFRVRADAQAAHEAIRPTNVLRTPDELKDRLAGDELKLYRLIWERFVACQMAPARIATRTAEIEAVPPNAGATRYLFRASTSEILFPGYMRVSGIEEERKAEQKKSDVEEEESESTVPLPPLEENESLEKLEWTRERKETQPPPRYTEASLVKALEENGVGRPSTYATIVSTILDRKYVVKDKKVLKPTPMGFAVNDFLVHHLPALFDVQFTARMEEELDAIEAGKLPWLDMLKNFYGAFQDWVQKAKGARVDPEKAKAVLDLLAAVKKWKPPVRRGPRTFSDEEFFRSVRQQLEKGENPLSERQFEMLKRLAARYRDQIPDFEARAADLGIEAVEEEEAPRPEQADESTKEKIAALAGVPFEPPRKTKSRTYDDRAFYESLRRQVEEGRQLTANQLHHLDRLVKKYAAHIDRFEERAEQWGIEKPAGPDPQIEALVRLAKSISEWKPSVTKGERVWDDKAFVESLVGQFETRKTLSPKQVSALRRLVARYADKIAGFDELAEQAGLRRAGRRTSGEDAP